MKLPVAISTLALLSFSHALPQLTPWPAVPGYPPVPYPYIPPAPHVLPPPGPIPPLGPYGRPIAPPRPIVSGGHGLGFPGGGVGVGFPGGPGNGDGNGNNGGGNGNNGGSNGSGRGVCGLTRGQVAALTPLLKKLGLAKTGNEVKKLVNNIVQSLGDLLNSDGITQLLGTVDQLINGLGLAGLDLKPGVDEIVSILRNQVPCLLNTLVPLP
ncbi:hypothetical protein GGH94_000158 [Coemansia aciculifera]|uniref:Uncharacterized protein n=1 Tax=Coemansia aciculifera TaxID=417176 RepID=A0A9W8M9B0_9FUNG|nr:hypothetical protein GGH94_000158 [Coemansia aciculifera]